MRQGQSKGEYGQIKSILSLNLNYLNLLESLFEI